MKIAIAGYGVEGKASYAYWNTPEHEVVIVDEREIPADELPVDASVITGEGAFSRLKGFDMVVRTAGLAPKQIVTDGTVWSATNEFFARCPAPIIGVTGTKGKGTTSSLAAAILTAAGKTVHLVGNIGQPALSVLPNIQPSDIVVYELSSFQLWDLERSPHMAVVLMIEPDHLDVHADMRDYVEAKAHIVLHQTADDFVVYNQTNDYSTAVAERSLGQKVPFPHDIRDVSDSLRLPGQHNLDNASAAILAVRPFVTDPQTIRTGLASFTGLPHRLKYVATVDDVQYYDDSIATTPGSAIAAIRSFSAPKLLLLGGSSKGAEYDEVIRECKAAAVTVVAIGQTGEQIAALCEHLGVPCQRETGDMTAIVATAQHLARPGGVVILSPASASFDMFKNYADRGEQFSQAVQQLEGSHAAA